MTTLKGIRARITPWDDPAFVRDFETARERVGVLGIKDGPMSAAKVERLLREAGYPDARVDVIRTVKEALEQTSLWIVKRDG
jgi:hypothetical protein